jgi:hypothetical protein
MTAIFIGWGASAVVIIGLALALGFVMKPAVPLFGILIDTRGRYSLTHLQLVFWSIIVLSLVSGVFWGRLTEVSDPLSFTIPDELLGLLGITAGSAVTATAIKAAKNITRPNAVAASSKELDRPRLSQIFLIEEGEFADKVIDVTKFQNFIITIVLMVAYIGLAIDAIEHAGTAAKLTVLPGFSGTFLVLVGISHAAYIAGKLPDRTGTPEGLTVDLKPAGAGELPPGVLARNPPPT